MLIDILIAVAEKGGVENVINMEAAYLQKQCGDHVRVVQMVWEGVSWTEENLAFYPLLTGREGHTSDEMVEVYSEFLRREGEPDLVLATAWPLMCYVARKATKVVCSFRHIPIVSWLHTKADVYEVVGYGKYAHLALADVHLAISQEIANDIKAKLPMATVISVRNPVRFTPNTIRSVLQRKSKRQLYYVGRISGEKRLDIIIAAWLLVKDSWDLTIVGDGEAAQVEPFLESTKGEEGIHFLGWQANPWEAAEDIDAVVLASEYEGFSLTAIEALSCGIPVISTPVSGMAELIRPGVNGYLFPHGDWEGLAQILQCMADGRLPLCDPAVCVTSAAPYQADQALPDFAKKLHQCAEVVKQYELSIVAIVKNERDILEWIAFHQVVGVEHFYIYDNESTDGLKEKLAPYIEAGICTYIYYPGRNVQREAYLDCIRKFRNETKWLAVIDGDEYLLPVEENKSLVDVIHDIENIYEGMRYKPMGAQIGAIGVNWRVYGTSFHEERMKGLCIENYTYRAQDGCAENAHVKCIVNPCVVTGINTVHDFIYQEHYFCISEKGSIIDGPWFPDGMCTRLRINHYHSKSLQEYRYKLEKRGWCDGDWKVNVEERLRAAANEYNEVYDDIMNRWIPAVKESLSSTGSEIVET